MHLKMPGFCNRSWVFDKLQNDNFKIMNSFLTIAIAGIVATGVMTLFTYIVGRSFAQNLRVVQILGYMIRSFHRGKIVDLRSQKTFLVGGILHYLIGVGFTAVFYWLKNYQSGIPLSWLALLCGSSAGILAIICWRLFILFHPRPPILKIKTFYRQYS